MVPSWPREVTTMFPYCYETRKKQNAGSPKLYAANKLGGRYRTRDCHRRAHFDEPEKKKRNRTAAAKTAVRVHVRKKNKHIKTSVKSGPSSEKPGQDLLNPLIRRRKSALPLRAQHEMRTPSLTLAPTRVQALGRQTAHAHQNARARHEVSLHPRSRRSAAISRSFRT